MRKLLQVGFILGGFASVALGFVSYFGFGSVTGALWAVAVSQVCSAALWASISREAEGNAKVAAALRTQYELLLDNYKASVRRETNALLRAGDPGDREVGS